MNLKSFVNKKKNKKIDENETVMEKDSLNVKSDNVTDEESRFF